jgi:hypothetical protein
MQKYFRQTLKSPKSEPYHVFRGATNYVPSSSLLIVLGEKSYGLVKNLHIKRIMPGKKSQTMKVGFQKNIIFWKFTPNKFMPICISYLISDLFLRIVLLYVPASCSAIISCPQNYYRYVSYVGKST